MGVGTASFHMEPMGNAAKTLGHNTRGGGAEVGPANAIEKPRRDVNYAVSSTYDFSTIRIAELSAHEMAKKKKRDGYAPLQEGILELPDVSLKEGMRQAETYAAEMKKLFGFKCIGIAVHYDEGHVEPDGTRHVHKHAHLVFDRRLDNGKMHNLKSTDYRQMQTIAAAVTGLPRGEDARDTHGTTLHHMEYRRRKRAESEARAKERTELQKRFAMEREEFRVRIEKLEEAVAAKNAEIIQLTRIATPAEIEAYKTENATLRKQLDVTQKELNREALNSADILNQLNASRDRLGDILDQLEHANEDQVTMWRSAFSSTYNVLLCNMKELGKLDPERRCKQADYAEAMRRYNDCDFEWVRDSALLFGLRCWHINPDYELDHSNQPDKDPEKTQ